MIDLLPSTKLFRNNGQVDRVPAILKKSGQATSPFLLCFEANSFWRTKTKQYYEIETLASLNFPKSTSQNSIFAMISLEIVCRSQANARPPYLKIRLQEDTIMTMQSR